MPTCSICGVLRERLVESIIEESRVSVCEDCAKFGKIISRPGVFKSSSPVKVNEEVIEYIEEGYHDRIKRARERKGMTQEDLAKSLAEKSSTIMNIESGRLKPTLKLAKKLEVFLNIEIISKDITITGGNKKIDFKKDNLTIGDLLRMKKDD